MRPWFPKPPKHDQYQSRLTGRPGRVLYSRKAFLNCSCAGESFSLGWL